MARLDAYLPAAIVALGAVQLTPCNFLAQFPE